jgi:hypothetical protein
MHRARVLAVGCAVLLATSAGRAAARVGGYAQEAAVAKAITSQGITYAGVHRSIDRAHCLGRRLSSVHDSGSLAYHRLTCELTDADRHVYDTEVLIVSSWSTGFSWQIVSGKRRH